MSALDDLKEIDLEKITPLEAAIVFLSNKHEGDAALAAAELLALRERVEKLEKQLLTAQKTAVYFHELGHGVRPSAVALRLLKEYKAIISQ